jgi:hypothetical protein
MGQELDEHEAGRAVRLGVMIGIPVVFVLIAVATLLAGQGLSTSVQSAGWPAVVAGPYVGGVFGLLYGQTRAAEVAEVHELPRPAAEAAPPAVERRAA